MGTLVFQIMVGSSWRRGLLLAMAGAAKWSKVTPKTQYDGGVVQPQKRQSATCNKIDKKLYLIDGSGPDRSTDIFGDVWTFDTDGDNRLGWTKLGVTGDGPAPRDGAASAVIGSTIWLFGGQKSNTWVNDIHSFSGTTWSAPTPAGDAPSARSQATMSAV